MNLEYGDIFLHRGRAYDDAMRRYPRARDAEFALLFAGGRSRAGQRVLDIPAGGGYLRRHLAAGADLVSLELTVGFGGEVPAWDASQPWTFGKFGHAVCLAALHHMADQAGFLRMLLGYLQPQGTLHVADVRRGSGIDTFLDGFIGRYNVTGHAGCYLPDDPPWFAGIGDVVRCGEQACPWAFDDEAQMLDFCAGLFGLIDCPAEALREALREYVGFRHVGAQVLLDWRLLYVDLRVAA